MYMFMFITSIYYSAVQCINIDRLDLSDCNFSPFQVFFYSRGLNVFFLSQCTIYLILKLIFFVDYWRLENEWSL